MEHLSRQYDSDLEAIRSRVLQMGGLVEAQILAAIECFATGNFDLMAQVTDTDRRVNSYEVEIDDACTHVIARRQPAAGDLRLIMAVSKIVTDLERTGDEAEKIARMARQIYERGRLQIPRSADVRQAGQLAVAMLRRVLEDAAWHALLAGYFAAHAAQTPLYPRMAHEFLRFLEGTDGAG